jgi:ABC-2 type transport system ATP-binding protein
MPIVALSNLNRVINRSFSLVIPEFQLAPGELVAVLGGNGSGKTTLLTSLLGMRGGAGDGVRLFDRPLGSFRISDWCAVGVQLQDAGYNPLYRVKDAYKLHKTIYPHSNDAIFQKFEIFSLFKKRYGQLSTGEQQRIQLAMAMAHDPELLICDEPTSNLDSHFETVFCDLLTERASANPRFSCVLATHTAKIVGLANKILIVKEGRIDRFREKTELLGENFGAFGCSFVCDESVRAEISQAFLGHPGLVRTLTHGDTLRYYGDDSLKPTALDVANRLSLLRFCIWSPTVADLLEVVDYE